MWGILPPLLPLFSVRSLFLVLSTLSPNEGGDCPQIARWPIDLTDNDFSAGRIQKWIYSKQYDPDKCVFPRKIELGGTAGIGSATFVSVSKLTYTFENGEVYRPNSYWLWSSHIPQQQCMNRIISVDCFTLPLSVCGFENSTVDSFLDRNFDFGGGRNSLAAGDRVHVCDLARQLKKPTLWVIGQLIQYHWRFDEETTRNITSRAVVALKGIGEAGTVLSRYTVRYSKNMKLKSNDLPTRNSMNMTIDSSAGTNSNSSNCANATGCNRDQQQQLQGPPSAGRLPVPVPVVGSPSSSKRTKLTVAVHVRGGSPDYGRKPLDVKWYIEAIDRKEKEVAALGYTIDHVYLCSDVQEQNIKSTAFMTETFPRNYTYAVLPHITFGPGEAEHTLRQGLHRRYSFNDSTVKLPDAKDVYTEFVADIEIMTKADIFIGTHSNLYALAGTLRMAHYPQRPAGFTCFLDSHKVPPPLICEGTDEARAFWVSSFSRYWGLRRGTPFLY